MWLSNFTMNQNHLKVLLKYRFRDSTSRACDSVSGATEFLLLTSSWVMCLRMVWGPSLESLWCRSLLCKVWSTYQQYQYDWGACQKCRSSGSTQTHWIRIRILILTWYQGGSSIYDSHRNTDEEYSLYISSHILFLY